MPDTFPYEREQLLREHMPQVYGLPQPQVPDKIQEKGCTRGDKPRHCQGYRH